MVRDNLEGKAFHNGDGVGKVTLYHEPGAGGTTSAKHVLWDLRAEYRCAEVKTITPATYDQIVTFHSFKESTQPGDVPRPVLLLLDNPDEDKAIDLMTKMKEEARKQAADQDNMYCVFLLVLRKKFESLLEDDDFNTLVLRQHFDDDELEWFHTTYEDMEQRKETDPNMTDPKTLFAFNIMKQNFNRAKIETTVRDIVNRIKNDNEVKLLKMLALLNMYDIHQRPVPASAFDYLMNPIHKSINPIIPSGKFSRKIIDSHVRPDAVIIWENHLSQDIRILLNVNAGHIHAMNLKTLSIFHPLMSEAILKVLRRADSITIEEQRSNASRSNEKIPLSDIVLEVLLLPFLKCKAIMAIRTLLRTNIAGILKNRERRSTGELEKFSPLVLEVAADEGTAVAFEVLKTGFQCTDDPFVCQQLARMLIKGSKWDEAEDYAKKATDAIRNNSWLWHTRGEVYRRQLGRKTERDQRCLWSNI